MTERLSFDFAPALENSPCNDCPVLIEKIKHAIIARGLSLIKISELCPDYNGEITKCIVEALETN